MARDEIPTPEGTGKIMVDHLPDLCPICHVRMVTNPIGTWLVGHSGDGLIVETVFQCANNGCNELFISKYYKPNGGLCAIYRSSVPYVKQQLEFDEDISQLSAAFTKIYNQAHTAESDGLDEIAGIGYRKALEFLIKDYCILKAPDSAEKIKAMFLGKCIKECVDNPLIIEAAERAVWLGNDETHYVRKWEEHDIMDLKRLIEITQYWILMECKHKKYLEGMPR